MKKTFLIAASLLLAAGVSKVNAQLANYTVTATNLTEDKSNVDNNRASVAGVNTTVTEHFSKNFRGVVKCYLDKGRQNNMGLFQTARCANAGKL